MFNQYPPGTKGMVTLEQTDDMGRGLDHLLDIFIELDMPVSKANAESIRTMYRQQQQRSLSDMSTLVSLLYNSVVAEFPGKLLLVVNPGVAKYYDTDGFPFGDEVAAKFPSILDESREASLCLAMERNTASAFHSIRCLEVGLHAISRCLGLPDPMLGQNRNWGRVLAAISGSINQKWPNQSARHSGDGQFFESAYASLAAMRNPWRNATMHFDNTYNREEARYIFETVRQFMRHLAQRMDETGEPLID
jgi:hypothetical protein